VAGASGVRMGLPYFLPSLSLGSFGAITRLRSLAANHAQLFDICAAGPVAGAVVALATFLAGLSLTTSAASGDPSLVSLPRELLESSFLLGGLVQGSLGEGAGLCHPLVLAGWCGMVASALNLLPIGSTDGGRITQAAFGTATKQVASLMAYILLALDLLGPGVGFTFGVLSIFVQRGTERNIRDQFTTLDPGRRAAAALLLVMATLVLFPVFLHTRKKWKILKARKSIFISPVNALPLVESSPQKTMLLFKLILEKLMQMVFSLANLKHTLFQDLSAQIPKLMIH